MITNATITDRSSIPAGGTIRRSGRSDGSVTSNSSSKTDRTGPVAGGRTPASSSQLTITRASRRIE